MIHQLDVAMEDIATQRGGLVFVYNMYGSKYANFDYDLSQKMLTLLKGIDNLNNQRNKNLVENWKKNQCYKCYKCNIKCKQYLAIS